MACIVNFCFDSIAAHYAVKKLPVPGKCMHSAGVSHNYGIQPQPATLTSPAQPTPVQLPAPASASQTAAGSATESQSVATVDPVHTRERLPGAALANSSTAPSIAGRTEATTGTRAAADSNGSRPENAGPNEVLWAGRSIRVFSRIAAEQQQAASTRYHMPSKQAHIQLQCCTFWSPPVSDYMYSLFGRLPEFRTLCHYASSQLDLAFHHAVHACNAEVDTPLRCSVSADDPPPEFYDFTAEDFHRVTASRGAAAARAQVGMKTAAMRRADMEAAGSRLGPVPVRIHFPDDVIVQVLSSNNDILPPILKIQRFLMLHTHQCEQESTCLHVAPAEAPPGAYGTHER